MVRMEPAGNVPWKGGGSVVVIICPKETINTNGQQTICSPNSWPETRETGRIGKYGRNRFQREEFPVPGESRRQTGADTFQIRIHRINIRSHRTYIRVRNHFPDGAKWCRVSG